jgi:hypothetical protein
MQRPIERAWELQQRWSTAATVAHERIDRLRAANLVVLVVAAVVGAASALLHDQQSAVRALGVTTAVLLGAAGLVQQRYIGGANVAGWVETRLASERLKSAVWRTLGTGADPASVEADLLAQIDAAAADFARLGVTVDGSGEPVDPLPMVRSVADYKAERADGQASWHRGKIATLQ